MLLKRFMMTALALKRPRAQSSSRVFSSKLPLLIDLKSEAPLIQAVLLRRPSERNRVRPVMNVIIVLDVLFDFHQVLLQSLFLVPIRR